MWFDRVVQAKGVETNVVVLSLVGPDDSPCPGNAGCSSLPDGAETCTNILDFTRRFTHGSYGPVCTHNDSRLFADAVNEVAVACKNYQPAR